MAQILTPLRGDPALSARWRAAVESSGVRDKVIATVNNDEDAGMILAMGGTVIRVPAPRIDSEEGRVNYVAGLYDQMIRKAKTEWVILWDDDILPTASGVAKLVDAARKATNDTAGIVAVYPYSTDPGRAVLFFQPYGNPETMNSVPSKGVHPVWGGGTGLSIWRRETILKTLPWKSEVVGGAAQGWDRYLAIKLEALQLKTIAECSIRCRHDMLP